MAINLNEYKSAFGAGEVKTTSDNNQTEKVDWWNKDIRLFGGGFGLKQKERFFSQTAILLNAGLDLRRAMSLLREGEKKEHITKLIEEIENRLISGDSFSKACKVSGKFSDFEIYSLKIGEETGQMTTVLNEMTDYFQKSLKYRRQLISALAYPIFVCGFSFLVIWFMLRFLVPMFEDVFKQLDGNLPMLTVKIISISNWLGDNFWFLLTGIVLVVSFIYFQKKEVWFRKFKAALMIHLPVFGKVFHSIYLARLCQAFHFLLKAKVPLIEAMELTRKMVNFYPIDKSLEEVKEKVMLGHSLSASLKNYSFYPNDLTTLLEVGEEAGNLEKMFAKLAEQYNTQAEQRTAVAGSLLEPVLIVFLGFFVGLILIAMYLPLFQISSSF